MSYVLITGVPTNEATKMEVIDADGNTRICQNHPYPLEIVSATAIYQDGRILVCGGVPPYTDECHVYEKGKGWTLLTKMNKARSASASIPIQGGMLLLGGVADGSRTKTSQIVKMDNSPVTKGPELSEPRFHHCIATDDEEDASFLLGGINENIDATSTVWKLQYQGTLIQEEMPSMKKRRANFGCGLFRSSNHGGRKILVAAGSAHWGGANGGTSCEFIDITKQNSQWQLCSKSNIFPC